MPEVSYVGSAVLEAKALAAAVKAVGLSAEHFVGVAMAATPVDTGTLRGSETADDATGSGSTVTARVHTGSEASEYAFYVHEGTHARTVFAHSIISTRRTVKEHQHGGMAGVPYLEGPLLSYRAVHEEFVRRAVAAAF